MNKEMESHKEFKSAGSMEMDYDTSVETSKPSKQRTKMCFEKMEFNAANFPYLQAMPVGSECEIKAVVRKTGQRMNENMDSKKGKQEKVELEFLKIAEPEGEPKKKYTIVKRNEK